MESTVFYKMMAGFYDLLEVTYFANPVKNPREVVLAWTEPEDRILDICTGTGTNAIRIAREKPQAKVVGIDLSADMLKIARYKAGQEGLQNIRLLQMDATSMKFADHTFDKVLISLVLHEIDEALASKILAEARRVLKKNGKIIVTEWEPSPEWWRRLLFLPVHLLEPQVYKTFIKKDLKKYFEKKGFKTMALVHCRYSKVLCLKKMKGKKVRTWRKKSRKSSIRSAQMSAASHRSRGSRTHQRALHPRTSMRTVRR